MFAGLREHKVRSNPWGVIRRKSTRGKKWTLHACMKAEDLWAPPKHENGARKGGVRNICRVAGAQGAERSGECHQKKKHQGKKVGRFMHA
ncbi:MAG: hypothetical protein V8R80_11400 [Eubacterium sp.]